MVVSEDLSKKFPGCVLKTLEEMLPYRSDASHFGGELPLAVVMPENTEQVSELMKYCFLNGVPVVARGGGTSLTGASVVTGKGIVVDMLRMDRIFEVSVTDKYVLAGAGVRIDDLNERLARAGHMFPPDPGSSIAATVGGVISTNAGGLRCLKYGTTKDWILGVEAVLSDGRIIQCGNKTLKSRTGYDLTSLLVGSEGTLAIITKAYLKITNLPESSGRIVAYYSDISALGRAVADVRSGRIQPTIAEFLDRKTMDAVGTSGNVSFPAEAAYMLLLDVDGPAEAIDRYLHDVSSALGPSKPIKVHSTRDDAEMRLLYIARKGAYSSLLKMRRSENDHVLIGDIVVPPSELSMVLSEISMLAGQMRVSVALFGHIGDGNIHANMFVDFSDEEESGRVAKFHTEIARLALSHGGSVSAEHGIGVEKRELLEMEYAHRSSMATLEVMKALKSAMDPKGILNPGKVFL